MGDILLKGEVGRRLRSETAEVCLDQGPHIWHVWRHMSHKVEGNREV